MLNARNLSVMVTVTFILTVYLKQIPDVRDKRMDYGNGRLVKKIVAYSLQKQLELEREPVQCDANQGKDENSKSQILDRTWQKLPGTELHIYSSHEDGRLQPYTHIRILGMAKGDWNETTFCNAKSEDNLEVTKAVLTDIWSENWEDDMKTQNYRPVLLSCQLPITTTSIRVYLSKFPCDITKNTLLIYSSKNSPVDDFYRDSQIVVCVKPLHFQEDVSLRLMEWIEMNKILGAGKVNLYVGKVHPKTMKLLTWYEVNDEKVEIFRHRYLPGSSGNLWQKRKNEVLVYNHCLYQNLNRAEYILPVDIDELIVPKVKNSWNELVLTFPKRFASYSIRNAYFFLKDNRTSLFSALRRTPFSDPEESGKSFVSTDNTLTVFNHYALHVLKPGIGRCHFVSESEAQMNHYKKSCSVQLVPKCLEYLSSPKIYDNVLIKYKKLFEKRFKYVLGHVSGFLL